MKKLRLLVLLVLLGGCADFEEYVFGPDDYRSVPPAPAPYDPSIGQIGPPQVAAPLPARNQASFQPAVQTREPALAP